MIAHHSTPSGTRPLPIVSSITNQLQVGCSIRKYSVCSAFYLARYMDYLPAGSSRRRGKSMSKPADSGLWKESLIVFLKQVTTRDYYKIV